MRYVEFLPRESLQPVVRWFWCLKGSGGPGPAVPEPVLPDGSPELIFNLADPFVVRLRGAAPIRHPRMMFVGQIVGPLPLEPTGAVDLIGVRFQPNGAVGLFGEVASLTGRWIAVDELPRGTELRRLGSSLGDWSADSARVTAVEAALANLLTRRRGTDPRVARAVRVIRQSQGRVSIGALVRELNTSVRNLERCFLEQVGIPPKLLARITRFQRIFTALRNGVDRWSTVAIRCGYYDQSHLVRDFREFAGYSPGGFLSEQPELTRLFTPLGGPVRGSDSGGSLE
jgi:AraC-like DNA-binding protein